MGFWGMFFKGTGSAIVRTVIRIVLGAALADAENKQKQEQASGGSAQDGIAERIAGQIAQEIFPETMYGLRCKNNVDSMCKALGIQLVGYMEIDPAYAEDLEEGEEMDEEELIREQVEDFMYNLDNKELICKNFWNGKELI